MLIIELDSNAMLSDDEKIKKQNEVFENIKELYEDDSCELVYQYTDVMNGMAIDASALKLAEIAKLANVKSVYTDISYEVIPTIDSSKELINVATNEPVSIYKGSGTIVSIIDTGIDLDHEAFQNVESNASLKLNAKDVSEILKNQQLNAKNNASNIGVGLVSSEDYNLSLINDSWDVYVNEKIPFAFNYTSTSKETIIPDHASDTEGDHGTHVAGIAAGFAKTQEGEIKFSGIAPNAQILNMKVFGKERSGQWSDILAAIEDSILLGADVINLSLGASSGFSYEGTLPRAEEVINRVIDAGIILASAAGNDTHAGVNSMYGNNLSLAKNPDNGLISSPASFDNSFAVASINNAKIFMKHFVLNGRSIGYTNNFSYPTRDFASLLGLKEIYVLMDGENVLTGKAKDFNALPKDALKDKIVVVKRGEIFTNTVKLASEKGAIGLIVFDNVDGSLVTMAENKNVNIPSIFISKTDGDYLVKEYLNGEKTIDVKEAYSQIQNPDGMKMSDFSSWGVTPDLKLKPEITAPGGNIYSTTDNNTYGVKSGTSMATPCISGVSLLLVEYYQKEIDVNNLYTKEYRQMLIKSLMMSTADPVKFSDTLYYSPRNQGAGLVNFEKAINAKAFLKVNNSVTPKVDLGDDKNKTGLYEIEFTISNFANTPQTYKISTTVMTEKVLIEDVTHKLKTSSDNFVETNLSDVKFMSGEPYSLNDFARILCNQRNNTVTVDALSEKCVKIVISLSEEGKQYLDENYENGIYVEGFVHLDNTNPEGVDLNLPYLAFYGDWSEAPMLDEGLWQDVLTSKNIYPQLDYTTAYATLDGLLGKHYQALGTITGFETKDDFENANKIYKVTRNALAYDATFENLHIGLALLRNAKTVSYNIYKVKDGMTDEMIDNCQDYTDLIDYNALIKTVNFSYYAKSYFDGSSIRSSSLASCVWNGTDANGTKLEAGSKVIVVANIVPDFYDLGTTPNKNQTLAFYVETDNSAPTIVNDEATITTENNDLIIEFDVTDNAYIANITYNIYMNKNYKVSSFTINDLLPSDFIFNETRGEVVHVRKVIKNLFDENLIDGPDKIAYVTIEIDDVATNSSNRYTFRPYFDIDATYQDQYIVEGKSMPLNVLPTKSTYNNFYTETLNSVDGYTVTTSNPDLLVYDEASKTLVSKVNNLTDVTEVKVFISPKINKKVVKELTIKIVPGSVQQVIDEGIKNGTLNWDLGDVTNKIIINGDVEIDFNGATITSLVGASAITIESGNVILKNLIVKEALNTSVSSNTIGDHILDASTPAILILGGNVTLDNVYASGEQIQLENSTPFISSAINLLNGANLTLKDTVLRGLYGVNNKVEGNVEGGLISIDSLYTDTLIASIKDYQENVNVKISETSSVEDLTNAKLEAITNEKIDSLLNYTGYKGSKEMSRIFDFKDAQILDGGTKIDANGYVWTVVGGYATLKDGFVEIISTDAGCYIETSFKDKPFIGSKSHIVYIKATNTGTSGTNISLGNVDSEGNYNARNLAKTFYQTRDKDIMAKYWTNYHNSTIDNLRVLIYNNGVAGQKLLIEHIKFNFGFGLYEEIEANKMHYSPISMLVYKKPDLANINVTFTEDESGKVYKVVVKEENYQSILEKGYGVKYIPKVLKLITSNGEVVSSGMTIIGDEYHFSFDVMPSTINVQNASITYDIYHELSRQTLNDITTKEYVEELFLEKAKELNDLVKAYFYDQLKLDEIKKISEEMIKELGFVEEGLLLRDSLKMDTPMSQKWFLNDHPELEGTLSGDANGKIYQNATNSAGPYWATPYGNTLGFYKDSVEPKIEAFKTLYNDYFINKNSAYVKYKQKIANFTNIYSDGILNNTDATLIYINQIKWLEENIETLALDVKNLVINIKGTKDAGGWSNGAQYEYKDISFYDNFGYNLSLSGDSYLVTYALDPFDPLKYAKLVDELKNIAIKNHTICERNIARFYETPIIKNLTNLWMETDQKIIEKLINSYEANSDLVYFIIDATLYEKVTDEVLTKNP